MLDHKPDAETPRHPTPEQEQRFEGTNNDLILRDRHGDVQQDTGTLMTERESYERVRDGFAMAVDGCSHLMRTEPGSTAFWRKLRGKLHSFRRAAIQQGGITDNLRTPDPQDVRGDPLPWRQARDRLYDGLAQAEGGMRQLACCHRGDFVFAQMAATLEQMTQKVKMRRRNLVHAAARRGLIWMPGDP